MSLAFGIAAVIWLVLVIGLAYDEWRREQKHADVDRLARERAKEWLRNQGRDA